MRRAWLLLPALSSAAACFPARDNIHDPNRRPDAELAVVDTRQLSGECAPAMSLTSALTIVTISDHRRCIGLRAVGSSDPQGTDLEYRFALKTTSGFSFLDSGYSPDAGLVLTSAQMYALPFGTNLFRVYVRDEEHSIGIGEAVFAKTNSPPVALADTSFVIPVDGLPWALGESFEFTLSAAASWDPDGDPISFCWNDEACGTEATRQITVEVGVPDRVESRLRVFDGDSYSARQRPSIAVRAPDAWLVGREPAFVDYDTESRGFFELIDVGARSEISYPLADYRPLATRLEDADGDIALLHFGGGLDNYLAAFSLPDGALLAQVGPYDLFEGGGGPRAIVIHPGTTVAWMVSESLARAVNVSRTPGAVTLTPSTEPVPVNLSLDYSTVFADADTEGNLWVGQAAELPDNGNSLRRITPQGLVHVLDDALDEAPTSIAARPRTESGDGQVWVLFKTDPNNDTSGIAELRIYDTSGARLVTTPLPGIHAGQLAWIDDSEVWMALGSGELLRLDADVIASGATLDAAVIGSVPDLGYVLQLEADTDTGSLWAVVQDAIGFGSSLANVTPDLRVLRSESDFTDVTMAFVDEIGEPWFTDLDGVALRSSRTLDASRVLAGVLLPPSFSNLRYVSADSVGGLWAMAVIGGSQTLVRLGADGAPTRFIDRIIDATSGQVRISQGADRIAVAPDGTKVWLVNSYFDSEVGDIVGEILEVDLTLEPPTFVTIATGEEAEDARVGIFAPEGPSGDRRWVWSEDNGGEIRLLDGGSLERTFAIAGEIDFPIFWAAVAPEEGALCLTTRAFTGGSAGAIRSRILHADGSTDLVDSRVMPDYFNDLLAGPLASTTTSKGEYCWFVNGVVNGGWQIRVAAIDGSSVHRIPNIAAGNPTSVFPIDRDSAWLTVSRNDGNGLHAVRMLVEFPPVVGSSSATITEIAPTIDGQFIGPFSDYY